LKEQYDTNSINNSQKEISNKNPLAHIAVYALTKAGSTIAAKLANNITNSKLIIPEKFRDTVNVKGDIDFFTTGEFTKKVSENWHLFKGHIFVMATGIVVRKIAIHLKDKTVDPAVVVCDEKGEYAISLLSGHIGGANRIAKFAASILKGIAVITTATDIQGLMAFDELAAINDWKVANPTKIKILNSMLLEGKKIALIIPENLYNKYYNSRHNLTLITPADNHNSLYNRNINSEHSPHNAEKEGKNTLMHTLKKGNYAGAVILTSLLPTPDLMNIPKKTECLLLDNAKLYDTTV